MQKFTWPTIANTVPIRGGTYRKTAGTGFVTQHVDTVVAHMLINREKYYKRSIHMYQFVNVNFGDLTYTSAWQIVIMISCGKPLWPVLCQIKLNPI